MGTMGCMVLIQEPTKSRSFWGFHTVPCYYVGPALYHYRCFTVFPIKTRSIRQCETVEFRHDIITVPVVTPEDKVVNAISKLKQELAAIPSPSSNNQLTAIERLQTMFSKFKNNEPSTTIEIDKNMTTPHQHYDTVQTNQPSTVKKQPSK